MEYPKRVNAKISIETLKKFEEIKEDYKKLGIKISYRTAIEFFVESYFNPDSINGLKLKKFLKEKRINDLENQVNSTNNELLNEKKEYEKILNDIHTIKETFNPDSYDKGTIEIAKAFINQINLSSQKQLHGLENDELFKNKLKTTKLKEKDFKNLLSHLILTEKKKTTEEIENKLLKLDNLKLQKDLITQIKSVIMRFLEQSSYNDISSFLNDSYIIKGLKMTEKAKNFNYTEKEFINLIIDSYNDYCIA